jgi:hypothetical protein
MAYFAKINEEGVVESVVSINNFVIGEPEKSFPETELLGVDFILNTLGFDGKWKQTSYNKNFRKNYAGIGYIYDSERDAFIAPEPINAIGFDENTCRWITPEVDLES